MAAPRFQSLLHEATCSVCLDYFTDPVSIDCGHNFCRPCITLCWERLGADHPCPQCRIVTRGRNLRPNWELRNIVEMIRIKAESEALEEEDLCPEHGETLKLFCEDDQRPICLVCRESKDHTTHTVRPVPEAAQEYKEQIYRHLGQLTNMLGNLQKWAAEESRTASELVANVKNQTEKILSTFEHLKQVLEKEKQQLLSRLEKEQEENMKTMKRKLTQLERDVSSHIDLITELERKCQQQDVDLLKDVKSILVRCENARFLTPHEDAVGMGHSRQSVGPHTYLQDKLLELKDTFPAELEWRYVKSCEREVNLDPDTAHPWLILSEDGRSVSLGDHKQDLPDTLQRFTKYVMALGRERLTSGRHYWEVEVGGKTAWDLGACDESVSRNGELTLSPEGGLWVVRLMNGKYWALTSSRTPLNLQAKPRVLGLFLDYEAGRLSVYDAQDQSLLFTFSGAPFACTLRPLFGPQLNTGGRNAGALRILTETGQD